MSGTSCSCPTVAGMIALTNDGDSRIYNIHNKIQMVQDVDWNVQKKEIIFYGAIITTGVDYREAYSIPQSQTGLEKYQCVKSFSNSDDPAKKIIYQKKHILIINIMKQCVKQWIVHGKDLNGVLNMIGQWYASKL